MEILDASTLRLNDFSFQGSKPPDGWLFAGRGRVTKETGKKAIILGRDTKALWVKDLVPYAIFS